MRRFALWFVCFLVFGSLVSLGCERDPGPKVTWPTTPLPKVEDLRISSTAGGPSVPAVPPKASKEESKDQKKDTKKGTDGEKPKADK